MTTVQRVAQIFGWVFVVVAIWGAVVTGTSMEADPDLAPRLWALFPVNFLHNLVHLLLGIWGIRAAGSVDDARTFTVVAGALYVLLAVLGLFVPDGLGFLPLGGSDVGLHAVAGVVLFATGVVASSAVASTRVAPGRTRTVLPPNRMPPRQGATTGPAAGPDLAQPAGTGRAPVATAADAAPDDAESQAAVSAAEPDVEPAVEPDVEAAAEPRKLKRKDGAGGPTP